MSRGLNQKLKLYRLYEIMLRETDEAHGLTVRQIISHLEEVSVTADRKSIYNDLEALEVLGLTIDRYQQGRQHYYYVAEKRFEMAELKLLVDAIQSSKFITEKKSNTLIKKLTAFTSRYEALQLDRQVYVSGRIKTMNESIYYNVDAIYNAIAQNRRIRFEYLKWDLSKKLVPRREGLYEASPWGLVWFDENYYLVAYDSAEEKIKHYRVDKMRRITGTDSLRDGQGRFEHFDAADYTKKSFGMFGGEETAVTLRFDNALIGVLLDRFGKEIMIRPVDEDHSSTTVKIDLSPQFFGWVFGLGGGVVITSPKEAADRFRDQIKQQAKLYDPPTS